MTLTTFSVATSVIIIVNIIIFITNLGSWGEYANQYPYPSPKNAFVKRGRTNVQRTGGGSWGRWKYRKKKRTHVRMEVKDKKKHNEGRKR